MPLPFQFLLCFLAVALAHGTLLRLPYFWDEAGYYIPAALDFYRTGTLIPVFTNAHPPLPNVVLGTLYHLFGFHFLVTRLAACAFAAAALLAVYKLGFALLGRGGALLLALLTGIYPIWFAQSSLAHADIFAAAFTLAAFSLFLSAPELGATVGASTPGRLALASVAFCLSVLSKETAVIQPAAVTALTSVWAMQSPPGSQERRRFLRWAVSAGMAFPVLLLWYADHYSKTGFVFGNPVYLRYNATANFTVSHVFYAIQIRFLHLFWQRNLWVPVSLAAASLLLPVRDGKRPSPLPRRVLIAGGVFVAANLAAFSVLGGALLTRYLLPVYPLLLLVCIAVWKQRVPRWGFLGALTAAGFLFAIWVNPWAFFAPEDNLTYRDLIQVHRDAISYIDQNFSSRTVLSAWPATAELARPELGYTAKPIKVYSVEDFSRGELERAAAQAGRFDLALIFTTHYISPSFRSFLLTHPRSWRSRRYLQQLDMTPAQVADLLGGEVVWREDRNGEWAAVIRFNRTYEARR